jgi:ribosomal protein L14
MGVVGNLRREGVLAPRYEFINLDFNGSPKGVYAIEEHFATELYESQHRREGVVIAGNDTFEVSRAKHVDRDPDLAKQRDTAIAMLKAFQEGQLSAAEVFDVELTAKFLAIVELWRAYHTLSDWNTHFYYNPVTAKLEPIGRDGYHYDNVYNWAMRGMDIFSDDIRGSGSRWRNQSWISQVLADPIIAEAYVRQLERISQPAYLDQLRSQLQSRFKDLQLVLYRDPDLDPSKNTLLEQVWQTATERQESVRQSLDETNLVTAFVKVVTTGKSQASRRSFLQIEVSNRLVQPVEVLGFKFEDDFYAAIETWQNNSAGYTYYRPGEATVVLPLAQQAQPDSRSNQNNDQNSQASVNSAPEAIANLNRLNPDISNQQAKTVFLIPLPDRANRQQWQQPELPEIRIAYRLLGISEPIETTVYNYPQTATPSVNEAVAKHAFLAINPTRPDTLVVKPGQWDVVGDLVIPRGMKLQIKAGTMLRFEPEAILLIEAGLEFMGTASAPIVLTAQEDAWAGIAAIAPSNKSNNSQNSSSNPPSTWQYVNVDKTTGISRAGWLLKSSITFHNSTVAIRHSQITNSTADNALRLSNSKFELSNSKFNNHRGDAIDAEFSNGTVRHTVFTNIQAEAIDTEGTELEVINSQFQNIGDKAISAGQRSQVSLQDLIIKDVGIAIASLDAARVQIKKVAIENASQAGLIAYQARSQWGSANISAQQVSFAGTRTKILVEAGSRIELDGNTIDALATAEFWAKLDNLDRDQ